jgi:hypothetical protein
MTWRTFLHSVLLLFAVYLLAGTTADPDLWGHVRFGQDMLAERTVHVRDAYSFASDKPWVNHEWLSELLMAVSFNQFGVAGLVVLRLAILAGVIGLLWSALPRRHHFNLIVVSAGALGIFLRAHPIRPQLLSLLMFAIVARALYRSDEKRSLKPLLVIPPTMALWVNLHGGWIVGFAVLGLWAALRVLDGTRREQALIVALLVAAAGATLVNPYGFGMWAFLAETVRMERPMVADWQPTYMLPPAFWGSWLTSAGIAAVATRRGLPAGSSRLVAITVALGLMTIRVSRLDALFAIAAVLLLARSFSTEGASPPPSTRATVYPTLRWGLLACAAIMALAITARASNIPVAPNALPDRHVVEFIQRQELRGKMLTWFDWGQYVIWHFGPNVQVSMDGRRETVYSEDVVKAHLDFYFGQRDEWRYADELGAEYALLPSSLPGATRLRENGWHILCEGESTVLLTREPGRRCAITVATSSRRFPEL